MAPDGEVDSSYIVWLDPGLTTGVAAYDLKSGEFFSAQYGNDTIIVSLRQLADAAEGRMAVGWEQYLVAGGPQRGTSKHSQEVIGRVRELTRQQFITRLKPQPSSARKLGSRVFLRRLGWYRAGQMHANDAAMHLLAYLLRMRPMPPAIRASLYPGYDPGVTIAP